MTEALCLSLTGGAIGLAIPVFAGKLVERLVPVGLLPAASTLDWGILAFTAALSMATGLLFSGDAVYAEAKLSWDDADTMVRSLERLADLAPSVRRVFPGHDRTFDGQELVSLARSWIAEISG